MRQLVTRAIVLNRIDYGEADRILTVLTPDHGKLSLLAKGVRRVKSKLAGGIELFSISDVVYIRGRSDMGTLVSTRLIKHYDRIVTNLDRTMFGYELMKQLHKATEDEPEEAYFDLLQAAFEALNDDQIALEIIRLWFAMQLLRIAGHTPNLQTDTSGEKLKAELAYNFSFDDMAFTTSASGQFTVNDIKFLRVGFAGNSAKTLSKIQGSVELADACATLVATMQSMHIRT